MSSFGRSSNAPRHVSRNNGNHNNGGVHLYGDHEMSPNTQRSQGFTNNAYSPTSPPYTTSPSPAPRTNYYSNGGMTNQAYDGNLASPTGSSSHYYSPRNGPASRGMKNEGYLETSLDDVAFKEAPFYEKRDANGHVNRGYIPSVVGSSGPVSPTNNNTSHGANIPVYTIDGGSSRNGPGHNRPPSVESKSRTCQSRSKCFAAALAIVLAVIVIGVAVFLGIYLGTDLIRKGPVTTSTTTTPVVSVENTTLAPENTTLPNLISPGPDNQTDNATTTSTSMPSTQTTAAEIILTSSSKVPELPEGDTVAGQVKLDQTYTSPMADPSSAEFQLAAQDFTSFMDLQMSQDPVFNSTYNRTEVISLQSGSVIVIFRIIFNTPVVRSQVTKQVIIVLDKAPSSLSIVVNSLVITEFVENTACGQDSLILCDGVCKDRSTIACDGKNDCVDWFDEFECPGQSVTCDFETSQLCGYTPRDTSQYSWVYHTGETPTPNTGPDSDHTFGNDSGHYYYSDWCPSCPHGEEATLVSPWYVGREDSCLTFYYSMKGHPTEMGSLYVYSISNLGEEKVLWTRENPDSTDQTGVWREVKVNIAPSSYQFNFGSFLRDESQLADKAIDDIHIETGACPAPTGCDDGFYCAITSKCIPQSQKPLCNGKFECPDQSDEQNCPGSLISTAFESGYDLTGYSLQTESSVPAYNWKVESPAISSAVPGTYFDNTYRNPVGNYITAIPQSASAQGTASKLVIDLNMSSNQERCLQFYYNMNYEGTDSNSDSTLKAQVRNLNTGSVTELWSQTGNAGREWIHVSHSIQAQDQSYQIEFLSSKNGGDGIVTSLDDITVMNGFCLCDDPTQRQCPDRACIPEEWFCDGYSDCSMGEDEYNCPTCEAGQFQCRDKSCVDGGDSIRCDGIYQCADGYDEDGCAIEDMCTTEDCIKLRYTDGNNFAVCSTGWDLALNDQICKYLYKGSATHSGATAALSTDTEFLQLTNPSASGFITKFNKVDNCPLNNVMKIGCSADTCGRRQASLSPYIIGGSEVSTQGRWPWLVDLKFLGRHTCGGALLSPHWILTAAHCVQKSAGVPASFSLALGTTDLQPGQVNSIEANVSRVIVHPKFTNTLNGYDIALLLVEEPISYTSIIQPICMPEIEDTYSSRSQCYLAGWGKIDTSLTDPDVLQEAKFKLTSREGCNSSSQWSGLIQDHMTCAGYSSGSIRSCSGDSGGPLVCLDKLRRWTVVGVTSFGPPACLLANHKDDVFTQTSSFKDWVTDIIEFEFTCNNGNTILNSERLCDGFDDCGDNSDETRPCQPSVSCDFESAYQCGYTTTDWQRANGLAISTGELENTGPSYDHTSGYDNLRSSYMMTSKSGSLLKTPSRSNTSAQCMQFYYYTSYDSAIYVQQSSGSTIGQFSERTNGLWVRGEVDMPAGSYSIHFQALINQASYIAIDDVRTYEGSCSGSCLAGEFRCGDSSSCIRDELRCDGIAHCGDSSDESGCSSAVSETTCSFNSPFGCGMIQLDNDDSNWKFQYGYSDNLLLPQNGHQETDDEEDSEYLLYNPVERWQKASISWPLSLSNDVSCVTMWVRMSGNTVGVLEIKSGDDILWQRYGDQGKDWIRMRVTVRGALELSATSGANTVFDYIAIDDLSVESGSCPAEPTSCDSQTEFSCNAGQCFLNSLQCDKNPECLDANDEVACGWQVNCNFDDNNCVSTGYTPRNRGQYLWTWDSNEKYLTADASSADIGTRAEYITAPFQLTSTQCLTFRYQQVSPTSDGNGNPELRVVIEEPAISGSKTVWSYAPGEAGWKNGRVTLRSSMIKHQLVRINFQALHGGNKSTELQLDDIKMAAGECSDPVCNGMFLCPYEEKCIPQAQRCDGISNCYSSADELSCGDVADTFDCNFDGDSEYCGWTRSPTNLIRRNAGSTALANTGPKYDHSLANFIGYYNFLDTQSDQPAEATFTSPKVQLSTPHCLSFYYYMVGSNIGYLNVTSIEDSGLRQLLISIRGAQELLTWHRARITLDQTSAMNIEFLMSSTGLLSNIALDDISIREGSCDCSGPDEYQCPTSGECFESFIECDDRFQCRDQSDESADKCACPDNDILCADGKGQCYPEWYICEEYLYHCLTPDMSITCTCNSTYESACPQGICYDNLQYCNGVPDCPDGSDEAPQCGENCPEHHIPCNDKSQCIDPTWWCDGTPDCNDGSDEADGCLPIGAGTDTPTDACSQAASFVCRDQSQVIDRVMYCNGRVDCDDGSDEPAPCECCPNTEFSCLSGDRCVNASLQCDGKYDCPDNSDESMCDCPASHHQCDNGLCLDNTKHCDGELDCNDWSDETNCNCTTSQFKCNSGRCIDSQLRCDNRDHCLDNSDEFDCSCSFQEFKCSAASDRRCIPSSRRCDGFPDCDSSTDEQNCGSCAEFMCTDYTCLPHTSVCDGTPHCSDGADEKACYNRAENLIVSVALSDGSTTNNYTVCYDAHWKSDWSDQICADLGFDFASSTRVVPTANHQSQGDMYVQANTTSATLQLDKLVRVTECQSRMALALDCQRRDCGLSSKLSVSPYIVGGGIVNQEKNWPWMLPIYYAGEFQGAGVHIGQGFVLTAGHIIRVQRLENGVRFIERRDGTPHLFQVGDSSVNRTRASLMNVSRVIVNERFSVTPSLRHDIALLKLGRGFADLPHICMETGTAMSSDLCYTAGWGSVDGREVAVTTLRDFRMNVLPDSDCVSTWNSGGFNIFVSSTMMCAGGDNLPSTCFGDSGGPMMCMNTHTGNWAVRGVVSFGERFCPTIHNPNVFTEVQFYYDWIQNLTSIITN